MSNPKSNKSKEHRLDEMVDDMAADETMESMTELSALPLKHFKLTTHPFADSVNPDYFFRTEAHEEAFIIMRQCVEDHISLGLTTAISGTGKTMLTQVLLQELDPRKYQALLVLAYPGMTRIGLLREITNELNIDGISGKAKIHDLIAVIQHHTIDQYKKGIRLVIIIDEVHFLQPDALHILRTLSNIEQPESKLVTVLLFGEQSFLTKMQHPSFRSIFSRMFARTVIRPLYPEEVKQYVKFRLLMAGGSPEMFTPAALDLLWVNSSGIPREINRICHNALSLAAKGNKSRVDEHLIARVPIALAIERG